MVSNFSKIKKFFMYIIVVYNYQFFELDVYYSDGMFFIVDQIFVQLEKIWNLFLQINKEFVGIFIFNYCNFWVKVYNIFIKDKVNWDFVCFIQKSIFIVCLDVFVFRVLEDVYCSYVVGQMLYGGGSRFNSGNCWFDKMLQFIVVEDGFCGFVYEYVVVEGFFIVIFLDYVIEYMKKFEFVWFFMVFLFMFKKLWFNIIFEIKSDIEKVKQNFSIMIQDLDIIMMVFYYFGKDFFKLEKLSLDVFIQMVLQLVYYRIYRQVCVIYESVFLCMFYLGCIDIICLVFMDLFVFVKVMDDFSVMGYQKVELLWKVVQVY